jgi:hypothetical protein
MTSFVIAQETGQQVTLPSWLQIAIQIVPVLSLIVGLPVISKLGKNTRVGNRKEILEAEKTELENEKLRIELAQMRAPATDGGGTHALDLEIARVQEKLDAVPPAPDGSDSNESRLLNEIRSWITRFLLLYLSLQSWRLISAIVSPIGESDSFRFLVPDTYITGLGLRVDAVFIMEYFFILGDALIFLILGVPLLLDIARFTGWRPRKFSRRIHSRGTAEVRSDSNRQDV